MEGKACEAFGTPYDNKARKARQSLPRPSPYQSLSSCGANGSDECKSLDGSRFRLKSEDLNKAGLSGRRLDLVSKQATAYGFGELPLAYQQRCKPSISSTQGLGQTGQDFKFPFEI